jgi:hypothetical protein
MQNAPERMNDKGTCSPTDTPLAHEGSGLVLYELIDHRGEMRGLYRSHQQAIACMQMGWQVLKAGEFIHQRGAQGPVKIA